MRRQSLSDLLDQYTALTIQRGRRRFTSAPVCSTLTTQRLDHRPLASKQRSSSWRDKDAAIRFVLSLTVCCIGWYK